MKSRRGAFCQRHTELEEHFLQARRRNGNQHLGRFATFVLEGMRRPNRHVGEHPGAGHEALLANRERDLAFEDVEAFLLPAVNVRRWPAARWHEGFPQGVFAVGVVAGRQEAVHVADHGDGAAITGFSDEGLCHNASFISPDTE